MCRFTMYLGPPLRLSALLLDPEHSLIRQSTHSREREEPLNGDGFGVGWYAPEHGLEPAVFRSITPAWNNRNLRSLSKVVASRCILAHVRAATQSSGVNEANCHPFRYQRYLFMHNGDVGGFPQIRRRMLADVSDAAYGNVFGSTDSEHLFAVFIDELGRAPTADGAAARIALALERAIARVLTLAAAAPAPEPSYLNCAVSDGEVAVVTRFTDDPARAPETLYLHPRRLAATEPAAADGNAVEPSAVVVSSERLTEDAGWQVIPPNHMVLIGADGSTTLRSLANLCRDRSLDAPAAEASIATA